MHAALKVIGASSETRHVPAGESISGISEQGSKGINTPKWIWKYLFAFDEEGVCKQRFHKPGSPFSFKRGGSRILIMDLLNNDFTFSIQTGE